MVNDISTLNNLFKEVYADKLKDLLPINWKIPNELEKLMWGIPDNHMYYRDFTGKMIFKKVE